MCLPLGLVLCCQYPLTAREVLLTLTPSPLSICHCLSVCLSLCVCTHTDETQGFIHARPHLYHHYTPNTEEQASQLVNGKPELSINCVLRSLI